MLMVSKKFRLAYMQQPVIVAVGLPLLAISASPCKVLFRPCSLPRAAGLFHASCLPGDFRPSDTETNGSARY
jgi:hypothetical protein